MQRAPYNGYPGPGPIYEQSFKEVLLSTDNQAKLPGGVLLAQGFGFLEKGTVISKISSGDDVGKAGPYASTVLTADPSTGATSITVADPSNFRVGDTVIVGTEAAAIAITDIEDNTITLASGLVADQANGAAVKVGNRSTALCILDNDHDTTRSDIGASGWIAAIFDKTKLIGLDSAAETALRLCYFG